MPQFIPARLNLLNLLFTGRVLEHLNDASSFSTTTVAKSLWNKSGGRKTTEKKLGSLAVCLKERMLFGKKITWINMVVPPATTAFQLAVWQRIDAPNQI